VLLLPEDPDKSAEKIKATLDEKFNIKVGVIISDTLGRAWRQGQTDAAIGAAGVLVIDDLRGTTDTNGKELEATIAAVGDELAGAAELVKGKASNLPVAIIRGLSHLVGESQSASALVRPPHEDLFRLGTAEAWDEGYRAGLSAREHSQ
jgi:coenzyme F420-0:L-glutamate ligase / coenzyme F420-1:gamma-L-glutamate ligase